MSEPETTKPTRRKPDPEVQAMAKIDAILAGLEPKQALRVTCWATDKARDRAYLDLDLDFDLDDQFVTAEAQGRQP